MLAVEVMNVRPLFLVLATPLRPPFSSLFLALLCALVSAVFVPLQAQQGARQNTGEEAAVSVWNVGKQGAFVMASLRDAQGRLWFGTEDKGVWCYDPQAPQGKDWRGFTVKDGLGDDNGYALAQDAQGRIWVGHQSHGVSVWNGQAWRNYDVLEGPLGERVFDIAVSPLDGDVWIGTSRGLARYSAQSDSWSYQGRWTGLPSDQIQALAFAKDGTLFVGTQCHGLVVGSPYASKERTSGPKSAAPQDAGNYSRWRHHTGPGWMPLYATGQGLPSDLINDILVGADGTVYVATTYGLARSRDNGRSFEYLRGKDWRGKLEGLTFPPQIPQQPPIDTLAEDYVTTLAEDADGLLWVGYPTKGVELRSPGGDFSGGGGVVETPDEAQERRRQETAQRQIDDLQAAGGGQGGLRRLPNGTFVPLPDPNLLKILEDAQKRSQSEKTDYVTSILPVAGAAPLVCGAGSGVIQLGDHLASQMPRTRKRRGEEPVQTISARWPSPAAPPSLSQLRQLTSEVQSLSKEWNRIDAAFVGEDWKTKGDWMGRYGMRYAYLCAMQAPLSHFVINDPSYRVEGRLGPHPYVKGATYANQGLRHWMHRKRWDDPRVLYNPLIGYRRQADIDDNGEVYPLTYEGPDMWVGARVPAGVHRVALYFFNKDGHDGHNRVRDYIVDIKRGHEDIILAENFPTLARTRVRDFWGGVYKQFVLQGPGDYYFVIRKNNSFNTVMQAVLIDKETGPPTGYETRRDVWLGGTRYEPPTKSEERKIEAEAIEALQAYPEAFNAYQEAYRLWSSLDKAYGFQGSDDLLLRGRVLAYRAAQKAFVTALSAYKVKPQAGSEHNDQSRFDQVRLVEAQQTLLRHWRWKLPLWPRDKSSVPGAAISGTSRVDDRQEFESAMQRGWKSHQSLNPHDTSLAR